MVAPAAGGLPVAPGHPIYVRDVINGGAATINTFSYSGVPFGVDLRSDALAGNFISSDRVSFITPAEILPEGAPRNPGTIAAWSDILALGTHYEVIPDFAYLADRHPIHTTRNIHDDAVLEVRPGSRVELWATFMTSGDLHQVSATVDRASGPGGPFVPFASPACDLDFDGEVETVDCAFEGYPPGRYRLTIAPQTPSPAPPVPPVSRSVAIWEITVKGCGDGIVDPPEQCDDGMATPACTAECEMPSGTIESLAIWRMTIEITTCDVSDGGTDQNVFVLVGLPDPFDPNNRDVALASAPFYLNRPGSGELNRGHIDRYDIVVEGLERPSGIRYVSLNIEGGDEWCIERVRLLFNANANGEGANVGEEAFFDATLAEDERWIGGGDPARSGISFPYMRLRLDPRWTLLGPGSSAATLQLGSRSRR
jgi:cysteine-rich repeat protein